MRAPANPWHSGGKVGMIAWNGTTRRLAPTSEGLPVTITLLKEPSFIARLGPSLQHNW